MKIYAMMYNNDIKYIGLSKEAVQKVVDHQLAVYKFGKPKGGVMPKVWLAEMEPIPTPATVPQARDAKGRFVKR